MADDKHKQDEEKAKMSRENQAHYADLLERLKQKAMTEKQRERLKEVEEENQGNARITYKKD